MDETACELYYLSIGFDAQIHPIKLTAVGGETI